MKYDDVKWHEVSGTTLPEVPAEGNCRLPNGCTLYWKTATHGGRVYYSDECGGGVTIWDTAIISDSTLLAALTQEAAIQTIERVARERKAKEQKQPLVNDDDEYIECGFCFGDANKCKCGSYYR